MSKNTANSKPSGKSKKPVKKPKASAPATPATPPAPPAPVVVAVDFSKDKDVKQEKAMAKNMFAFIEKKGCPCKIMDRANPTGTEGKRPQLEVHGIFDPAGAHPAQHFRWKIAFDSNDKDTHGWAKRYFIIANDLNPALPVVTEVTNNTQLALLINNFKVEPKLEADMLKM